MDFDPPAYLDVSLLPPPGAGLLFSYSDRNPHGLYIAAPDVYGVRFDAVVVGAGPAGGMAARELAGAGFRTGLVDKKKVVGVPIQCAEGVGRFALESNGLRPRPEWALQEIRGAVCFVPSGDAVVITRLPGYALDRAAFDRWIAEDAVARGADLWTDTRVDGIDRRDGGWRLRTSRGDLDAAIVVAADGPTSQIATWLGLLRSRDAAVAYEYRFDARDVDTPDPERFVLFQSEQYHGGYAWIFPRGDAFNVGAGGHLNAHAATVAFCRARGIDPAKARAKIAGQIPYRYSFSRYAWNGVAVAGDAAGVTNPMDGGGIHAALWSGRVAGAVGAEALAEGNPSHLDAYDRVLRSSPFLDPIYLWCIERMRTWSDRMLNFIGRALRDRTHREVGNFRKLLAVLREPATVPHLVTLYRLRRAMDLCEYYAW